MLGRAVRSQAASDIKQRILAELHPLRNLALDAVQGALGVVATVVRFAPAAGNAIAVCLEAVNLGIKKLRGHEITTRQVAMLAAVALSSGGAARLLRLGSRFGRTIGRVASVGGRVTHRLRREGVAMHNLVVRPTNTLRLGRTAEQARVCALNSAPHAGRRRRISPGYPAAGRTANCVNCAVALETTYAGRPASALPRFGRGKSISIIANPLMRIRKRDGAIFKSAITPS